MKSQLEEVPGILFGFGNIVDSIPDFAYGLWRERARKTQVHGTCIVVADTLGQDIGDADGVFTRTPGLLLTLVNADCFPLLFAKYDGSAVAALHVGWRGALGGIIIKLKELLVDEGENPAEWLVSIGPGAHSCCYEVSDQIIADFSNTWNISPDLVSPERRQLDLPLIIDHQLKWAGFNQLSNMNQCTMCAMQEANQAPAFHSFRRSGSQMPQVSAITIQPSRSKGSPEFEYISENQQQAMMSIYPQLYDFATERVCISSSTMTYRLKSNPVVAKVVDRIFYHKNPSLKSRKLTDSEQDSKYVLEWVDLFREYGGNITNLY